MHSIDRKAERLRLANEEIERLRQIIRDMRRGSDGLGTSTSELETSSGCATPKIPRASLLENLDPPPSPEPEPEA